MHSSSTTVSANGLSLHVAQKGSGQIAIVFLHFGAAQAGLGLL